MRENMKEKKFFNYHIIRKENIVTMKEQDTIKKKKKKELSESKKVTRNFKQKNRSEKLQTSNEE